MPPKRMQATTTFFKDVVNRGAKIAIRPETANPAARSNGAEAKKTAESKIAVSRANEKVKSEESVGKHGNRPSR